MDSQKQTLQETPSVCPACCKLGTVTKRPCGCIEWECGTVSTCDDYHHGAGALLDDCIADDQPEPGLYDKYEVWKNGTQLGERVRNCFVLRPDRDPDARVALRAYARTTPNDDLARDLGKWMDELDKEFPNA